MQTAFLMQGLLQPDVSLHICISIENEIKASCSLLISIHNCELQAWLFWLSPTLHSAGQMIPKLARGFWSFLPVPLSTHVYKVQKLKGLDII